MSLATQAMEIFEGPCSRTADGGCDACVSCRRRGLLHARLLEHFSFDAARQLRSGRRYLPSGNCNCATLPGMFIDLFQHIRPQAIQAKALARWDDWAQKRGPSFTMERMRDLKAVTDIMDDYFFQGTLGPYIKLRRVAFNTKALGKTTPFAFDRQVNAPRLSNNAPRLSNNAPRLSNSDPRVTIRITPPPGQKLIYRWTREIRKIRNKQGRRPYARPRRKFVGRRVMDIARGLQSRHAATIGVLSTVLHELGHAAFQIFGCQACCMRGSVGDCGHGEAWRRLCEAMEQQANRSLTGIGTWRVVD